MHRHLRDAGLSRRTVQLDGCRRRVRGLYHRNVASNLIAAWFPPALVDTLGLASNSISSRVESRRRNAGVLTIQRVQPMHSW